MQQHNSIKQTASKIYVKIVGGQLIVKNCLFSLAVPDSGCWLAETETDGETVVGTDTTRDTLGDEECDANLVIETEACADTELVIDSEPVAEIVIDSELEPEPELELELEPELELELEPELELVAEPELELELELVAESELDDEGVAVILTVAVCVVVGNK